MRLLVFNHVSERRKNLTCRAVERLDHGGVLQVHLAPRRVQCNLCKSSANSFPVYCKIDGRQQTASSKQQAAADSRRQAADSKQQIIDGRQQTLDSTVQTPVHEVLDVPRDAQEQQAHAAN
jgi:hypothetical protein